ncbi:MAG: thioesterase II family protein [Coprococcus sp.]
MRKIQLFCIPYAGGTAELFDGFCSFLPEEIIAEKIEYSGHGRRISEPFYKTFNEMVRDVAVQINEKIADDTDIALFGYSMGSIVAYELMAQQLLDRKPVGIMMASHEAPDHEWESKEYFMCDDITFMKLMQDMGGFERCTPDMLKNRFFRKLHFDPVRADYNLIGDYKMSRKIELDIPALLFYSSKDIPTEHIKEWKPFLGKQGEIIELGENHFFIREYAEKMACTFCNAICN